MVITPISGEKRFVSSISRRMKLMGAVTKGDRFSTMGDCDGMDATLEEFDINNSYGRRALSYLKAHIHDSNDIGAAFETLYAGLEFWDEDWVSK